MKTRSLLTAVFFTLGLSPVAAFSGEAAKGSNYLVLDNHAWPTGQKSGFYQFNGAGISKVEMGPIDTAAVECHGSGFWNESGGRGEGICLHGAGDDTYISSYKMEAGAKSGQWKILGGTGKYSEISGEGTYIPNSLAGKRAISNWQGEISLSR